MNAITIKYNTAFENPNGIYIDSKSTNDVINANSFTSNRIDTSYELGAFESGNGLLFGADFRTSKSGDPSRLEVKYNVLAHNEGYQAKNNPELPVFKLGDNWFDSTDDENTFVCPMLLAGIMKMGTISVKNGIGLQMYDTDGNEVKEFGTFDTKVSVNGNQYTAKFVNGKAIIDANLDSDTEYEVDVMIGGTPVKYKYRTAVGEKEDNQDSKTTDILDTPEIADDSGASEYEAIEIPINSTDNVTQSKGNSEQVVNGTSDSAHFSTTGNSSTFGTNASGTFKDSSDNGENAKTNGNMNAGDSNSGKVSKEGKAYEIVPPTKNVNKVTDTSGIVVLSIVALLVCLIYGYRRNDEFD